MIDFVFGKKKNHQAVDALVNALQHEDMEGSLYIGYPIFDIDDESLLTDALLITREHGVIAFDLSTADLTQEKDIEKISEHQDNLYRGLMKKFLSERQLVRSRSISFPINILSLRNDDMLDGHLEYAREDNLISVISSHPAISESDFKGINSAIQKTSVLRPQKKRADVKIEDSYGGIIKKIEKEIANLDRWQKKAAIESPERPQRIRGLAGCGKTIILAMKAAYIHAYNPDLVIAVTFQTRSLYQQLDRLISRFHFEHVKEDPDSEFLKIRHAWGSYNETGIYSEICLSLGIKPLSFTEAKLKYGYGKAFDGACQEALAYADSLPEGSITPIYDYFLIDEAQDFPTSFFKLIYKYVKNPKRIVWAYDELQNLGNFTMLPPEELFGYATDGSPNVSLENEEGKAQQDIMLPICYRNPPWTLTLALSLGLGIYRADGLVRMFSEPNFWKNIGYEVVAGRLEKGRRVRLQRSSERTPDYFNDHINPDTAILFQAFDTKEAQAVWVADQIMTDIQNQELEPSDILIVFPDAYTFSGDSAYIINELRRRNIDSHTAGKSVSRDIIFVDNSVAITHIHRAKGNEAPMVYVMDADYCYSGYELGKKRNALFTAITRAKAWVRISGVGPSMQAICTEISTAFEKNFMLEMSYPTDDVLEQMHNAYRDRSEEEKQDIRESFKTMTRLKKMYKAGQISKEEIPHEVRDLFE